MFTALASCVFLWGLQYKLSLYDPPQAASHQVPMAKLLSRNEQSDRTEGSTYSQTKPGIKVPLPAAYTSLLFLFIASILNLPASSRDSDSDHLLPQLKRALLETHFVRPPPSLL